MKRFLKQLIYGTGFLVVLGALTFGFYVMYMKQPESCFDNKQNQGEEGIDCGGPCEQFCVSSGTMPVELLGAPRVFYVGGGSSILTQVQNPNSALALEKFDYEFVLKGEDGAVLWAVPGSSFIYAQEVKYLFVPNAGVPAAEVASVDFKFKNPEWIPADEFVKPAIREQNFRTEIEGKNLVVSGVIMNEHSRSVKNVSVIAVFYGKESVGSPSLGASQTVIDNIAVGESKPFTVRYPNDADIVPEKTRVFVFALRS